MSFNHGASCVLLVLVYKYNGDGTWILCPREAISREFDALLVIFDPWHSYNPVTALFLVGSFMLSDFWVSVSPSFIHVYSTGYLFTVSHIRITSCFTSRHFRLAITDGHWNVNEKGHRKSQFGIQYTSDVWKLLKLREPSSESKASLDSDRFRNKSWPTDAIYVALWVNDLMHISTNFIGLMIVGSNNSFNYEPHLSQARKRVDSRR